jgi:pyruvate kinase
MNMDGTSPANRPRNWARTKIVVTVGPACWEVDQLRALIEAGGDIFRLNMAHGGPEQQQPVVERIREVSRQLNQPIAILVDLAGPKIRLGELPDDHVFCHLDETFYFVEGEAHDPHELTSTYEALVHDLSKGDQVMLADGSVAMRVEEVKPGRVTLRVVQQGTIRSRH